MKTLADLKRHMTKGRVFQVQLHKIYPDEWTDLEQAEIWVVQKNAIAYTRPGKISLCWHYFGKAKDYSFDGAQVECSEDGFVYSRWILDVN